MICDRFHSIDSQVKLIAYSCTRSLREQDGKYVTKYLVLNQLVMKICFQVYRDGNFFIPTDEVE